MTNIIKITTTSAEETKKIGFGIGRALFKSEVIALEGDIGSGKTTLLKGLAKGLGIKDVVNSPTFNILKRYDIKPSTEQGTGKLKYFYHIDAYRLNSEKELQSLGWEEIRKDENSIIAIEWAEKIKNILPSNNIKIKFKNIDERTRQIKVIFS